VGASIHGSQPLLFGNDLGVQVDRDSTGLAERLAQHYKILDFGPNSGHERSFLHRSFTAQANGLVVSCGYSTPVSGRVGQKPGCGSVNLVLSGSNTYEADGREYRVAPGQPFFYGPTHDYSYVTNHYNGVVFDIDVSRLKTTAASMLGMRVPSHHLVTALSEFKTLTMDGGRNSQLLKRLAKSLKFLEDPDCLLSLDIPYLQIDDLIYRHMVLLLLHRNLLTPPDSAGMLPSRERIFEELLEWIRENLGSPLNLTELEQRSGYSRRSLQNMFQLRFGCGPIQWIRRHRLEQAQEALLNPKPGESVTSIARRFGFNSLTVFSRDYNQAYGVNPSESLRLGRSKIL
jgi:AraC-like DNA-binding protein